MRTIRSGSWETIGLICCRGERREVDLIIVLMIVLLVLSLMESILHCIALKKIPFRILVNGTRGKTTTTRLIAAALRDKGIRTYAKTTGSDAQIIKDDGSVVMLKRRRGVRLTENISFVHKAAKAGCRCIVVECMALHEESQRMMASKFIRPTHTIIINTLSDHMDAMGEKREDVAWTLSQSVDKDTKLYVTEDFYDSLNVRSFNKVEVRHYDFESSVSVADEDVSLAVSLLKDFSLTEEEVLEAAKHITPDIGLYDRFDFPCGSVLYPTFSINDEENMEKKVVDVYKERNEKLSLIFNNRKDREFRIYYLRNLITKNRDKIGRVYIIGDYRSKVARYIGKKCSIETLVSDPEELKDKMTDNAGVFVGLGNIKGAGERLINLCM